MKTLRRVKFDPQTGTAARYWEENGFRRNDVLAMGDLAPEQQAIVSSALAWAQAKLPQGVESLLSVEIVRVQDIPVAWGSPASPEESPEPVAFSPAFTGAITGRGEAGEASFEIQSEPGPVADALAVLWGSLTL